MIHEFDHWTTVAVVCVRDGQNLSVRAFLGRDAAVKAVGMRE